MWEEVFSLRGSCLLFVVFVGSKLFKKNKIWFWAIMIIGVFFLFFILVVKKIKNWKILQFLNCQLFCFFFFFYFFFILCMYMYMILVFEVGSVQPVRVDVFSLCG